MNKLERLEEMVTVAEACRKTAENACEMAEIPDTPPIEKMMLANQAQILNSNAILLRNLGLHLARDEGA